MSRQTAFLAAFQEKIYFVQSYVLLRNPPSRLEYALDNGCLGATS
nr:MAG TPA: hypothetical protein [Inoviridae sp.]